MRPRASRPLEQSRLVVTVAWRRPNRQQRHAGLAGRRCARPSRARFARGGHSAVSTSVSRASAEPWSVQKVRHGPPSCTSTAVPPVVRLPDPVSRKQRPMLTAMTAVRLGASLWLVISTSQSALSASTPGPREPTAANASVLAAVLVARRDVCPSRLEFTRVFQRRSDLKLRWEGTIWIDSPRSRYPEKEFSDLEVLRDPSLKRGIIGLLGPHSEPSLVVIEPRGVVRMIIPAPLTPARSDQLVRWIASAPTQ